MVRLITTSLLLMLVTALPAAAIDVALTVEPINPVANESFRLFFRADGPVDAEPDFSELETSVEILGRNRQTSIQWINGRNSRTTTWVLDVIAQTQGPLTLPAVAFGSDTSRAVALEVQSGADGGTTTADPGLLLEIEVDNPTPYVQEQVILTARLLRRVELSDANMTDPSTDADAIIKRLGKDTTFQTMRNEKRYEVFERRYAVFPQTSGAVTINPLVLTTQLVRSARSMFDPFRQAVKTRRIESNAIVLDVKPIPAAYTGDTWLPAKRLNLRDDWEPASDTVEAGEPLTRTVFLWAEGLNAGQLPEVPIALPSGLKSYPDQPQTSEQQTDNGFAAIRQQKYAIIPNAGGEIVFPEIAVTWWNTVEDRLQVARLGEHRFDVNAGSAPAPLTPPAADSDNIVPTEAEAPSRAAPVSSITPIGDSQYAWVALVCLIGWMATAGAWWLRARGTRVTAATADERTPPESLGRARRDVLSACQANNARAAKQALIEWGRIALERPSLATLGDLAVQVPEPLNDEIRVLDASLYGRGHDAWDAFALKEAFKHCDLSQTGANGVTKNAAALPALYRLSN